MRSSLSLALASFGIALAALPSAAQRTPAAQTPPRFVRIQAAAQPQPRPQLRLLPGVRLRRVEPLPISVLAGIVQTQPAGSTKPFDLSPVHLAEPNRGFMELHRADAVYSDEGGLAIIQGAESNGYVWLSIDGQQGKTYVLDILAERVCTANSACSETFDVGVPGGATNEVTIPLDNPHGVVGFVAGYTGPQMIQIYRPGTQPWIFHGVRVTTLP